MPDAAVPVDKARMNPQTPPASRTASKPDGVQGAVRGPERIPSVAIKECQPAAGVDAGQREAMIREAACFRAERQAFASGNDLEVWLGAERESDWLLAVRACPPSPAEGTFRRIARRRYQNERVCRGCP